MAPSSCFHGSPRYNLFLLANLQDDELISAFSDISTKSNSFLTFCSYAFTAGPTHDIVLAFGIVTDFIVALVPALTRIALVFSVLSTNDNPLK